MSERFIHIFMTPFFFFTNVLLILGILYFMKLKKEKRANKLYWLPFLILSFTVFYENLAGYIFYNFDLNEWVNHLLGNDENPNYNVWFYNIANKYLATILYLYLIKYWIDPRHKKYINWMIMGFIFTIIFLLITGIEPIYLNQPIIFALGANMILVGCGLYFIGFITQDKYLSVNPLRLLSFWQMTFLLFTYSLTYINSVSLTYIYSVNKQLGMSLFQIDWVMAVLNLAILVLTIASPKLSRFFEKEPYYESSKHPGLTHHS